MRGAWLIAIAGCGHPPSAITDASDDATADAPVTLDAPACTVVTCPDGGPPSYATAFDGTENPISEGGAWKCGGVIGIDWQNPRTAGGLAYSDATVTGYTDPIAHLSGFPPDQFARGTVHRLAGYTPPSSHE